MGQGRGVAARGVTATLLVIMLLAVDQTVKIWVKTHMTLHESIPVFSWFRIMFIENNGMAYGMEFGSKLLLSVMRIGLIAVICVIMASLVRKRAKWGFIISVALVIAGAFGNIIDGMFYGMIFSESTPYTTAQLVDFGSGYENFLKGRVVDMLYFPLIESHWPAWTPWVGGQELVFFAPVFNIADASITTGVALLLLFYRKEVANLTLR